MSRFQRHEDTSFPRYFLKRSFRSTVEEALDRAQLVSFDVFDTLLRRPFLEPSHLFDALGTFWSSPQFGRERRWAEQMARNRHASSRDVTLDQIYAFLGQGASLELSYEQSALYPRADMTAWLSLARAKGKKVVAVSDMYLPHAFISEVLTSHRLTVDDLIVSSHDDVMKGDGSAFRSLSSRHGVAFEDILHFGDNPRSDYDVPVSLGIPSVLVANKLPRGADTHHLSSLLARLETNGSHYSSSLGSLIRDRLATEGPGEFWTDIGRYVVAPLMAGFGSWCYKEAEAAGIDRIAFSARDGKLPREAMRAFYGDRSIACPYVHLSRSVILRAGLDTRAEMVLYQLTSGIVAPVSDYVKRLGEGTEPLLARAFSYFGGDPEVGKDIKNADLTDFFHDARAELSQIAMETRPLLYRYLEQNDLLRDPTKVAIADIGWSGTAASILWDVVPESRNWTWLYFGTRREYKPTRATHKAMFFTYGVPWEHHELVFDCVEAVEFLFSAPEPSTVGLCETSAGIQPCFAPADSQWPGWAPRSEAIAEGFRDMLPHLARRAQSTFGLVVDSASVFTLLAHIVRSDDITVIREFGQLHHQLGFGASRFEALLPDGQMRYWSNVWRMLKGKPLKPPAGRRYWRNQLVGQFLMPLSGIRLHIARKALRVQARGGWLRRRRRR